MAVSSTARTCNSVVMSDMKFVMQPPHCGRLPQSRNTWPGVITLTPFSAMIVWTERLISVQAMTLQWQMIMARDLRA